MPRLKGPTCSRRRSGLRPFVLALALLPIGACSAHGGADGGAAAVDTLSPLPAPAGHLGDFSLPTPGATWSRARGPLGAAAMFLPQSFGGLVATLIGLPITLGAEIDEAVPVVGAAARAPGESLQIAIGVHVKEGARFVDQLTRGEGARFNAAVDAVSHVTLLTEKVAPERARLALGVLGNYLLVARRPADLHVLGPYLVRTLAPAPGPTPQDDLVVDLPEKALAGPIAAEVNARLGRGEGAAATFLPLAGVADTTTTLLSDAARARVTVNLDAERLHGRVAVTPKAGGGPASKLVADLAVGDVKPLLDLPDTTTLGLLWRESAAARQENAPKQADALARILGGEVTAEDRAAISAALRAEAAARGDWQAVGVAFNGTGPTAVVRAPVSDADAMKKALKQLVDLSRLPVFKKALAGLGIRLAADKTVVENLAADVTRVRLARGDDEPAEPRRAPKKGADPAARAQAAADDVPKAIDLLYFVDGAGLFAAAGYDPKESLRALTRAPAGASLARSPAVASALASIGGDAAFVLVADTLRISAMTTGGAPPATPLPVVAAAGRGTAPAELWGRLDVPIAVVQQLAQEYSRREAAP